VFVQEKDSDDIKSYKTPHMKGIQMDMLASGRSTNKKAGGYSDMGSPIPSEFIPPFSGARSGPSESMLKSPKTDKSSLGTSEFSFK
jgi:hypothetical protein